MAVTTLDRAKVSIVTQHPFFASILMKRKLEEVAARMGAFG